MSSTTRGRCFGERQVRASGVDVTDRGLDIRPNDEITGIEIELTNQLTEVSGIVTNRRGEAVSDYTVVIFPRDRERWTNTLRYVRTVRPSQDGRFTAAALPEGEYYAVALDFIDSGDTSDPEILDRASRRATMFGLTDGAIKTLRLTLIDDF